MLRTLISQNKIEGRAIVGFYPANQVNEDDVQLYAEDGSELCKFHMLRQ